MAKPKRKRGRPKVHDEAWHKVTVVLFDRLVQDLDARAGDRLSRAAVLRAAVGAILESGFPLDQVGDEERLKALLLERLQSQPLSDCGATVTGAAPEAAPRTLLGTVGGIFDPQFFENRLAQLPETQQRLYKSARFMSAGLLQGWADDPSEPFEGVMRSVREDMQKVAASRRQRKRSSRTQKKDTANDG